MAGFPIVKWWAVSIAMMDPRLSQGSKNLFAALMSYHNTKTGRCFPSERRLAAHLDRTERTIRTAVRQLTKYGYIVFKTKAGEGRSTQYRLWIPSGKKEYDKAERFCRSYRKKPSAKQMKEPLKEQKRRSRSISKKVVDHVDKDVGNAKKLEALQNAVVQALGGSAEAWEKLQRIDQESRDKIETSYLLGEMALSAATAKHLEAVQSSDQG